MLREGSLEEISDGKLYGPTDMVRADTCGCKGCARCCEVMVDTILLSPLDVANLCEAVGKSFPELVEEGALEVRIIDGLMLPVLKGRPKTDEAGHPLRNAYGEELAPCPFLSEEKRCTVHAYRPDLCRLFPLGRFYPEDPAEAFSYFLQDQQCDHPRVKTKIRKWIGPAAEEPYRKFLTDWHEIAAGMRRLSQEVLQGTAPETASEGVAETPETIEARMREGMERSLSVAQRIFTLFYAPYTPGRFYEEFEQRRQSLLDLV